MATSGALPADMVESVAMVDLTADSDVEGDGGSGLTEARPPGRRGKDKNQTTKNGGPGTSFTAADSEWKQPNARDLKEGDTWKARSLQFIRDFAASNRRRLSLITPELLHEAFDAALQLNSIRGKTRKAARLGLTDVLATRTLGDLLSELPAASSASADDHPSASEWASLLGSDDKAVNAADSGDALERQSRERRRYFPGVEEDALFCVLCSSRDHTAVACPETGCRFCTDQGHFSTQCPTRRRCQKCRQLGHRQSACQEKLALAPGEATECAFCASPDHDENTCTSLWRTHPYHRAVTRKVREIPAFCYFCGEAGHFGGDCPMNNGVHLSGRPFVVNDGLWSAASRDQYVDPNSAADRIAWFPPLPPESEEEERPNIPGHSLARQTHVYFTDSDGEGDNGFIREPVPLPRRPGNIQFSDLSSRSNNQGPVAGGRPNDNGYNQQRPPDLSLPPRPGFHGQAGQGGGMQANSPRRPGREEKRRNRQNRSQASQQNNRPGPSGPSGPRGGGALGARGPRPRRGRP